MQKVAFESLLCHRKRLGYRQSLQFPTAQPVQMTGPLTMSGEDLSPADFIYSFSRKDNREICRAVSQWKG